MPLDTEFLERKYVKNKVCNLGTGKNHELKTLKIMNYFIKLHSDALYRFIAVVITDFF